MTRGAECHKASATPRDAHGRRRPPRCTALQTVELDDESLAAVSRDQEQERQIAIFDLLEENHFHPEGAASGPYDLRMGLVENRLVFDVRGPDYA